MKNILKKSLALLIAIPLIAGCSMYHSKPATKSDMVGTYKLKSYTKAHDKRDDKYDYKAEIGAEAYFTLSENGECYYAYKDNEKPLTVTQAFAIFVRDDENENLYKAIEITDGISSVSTEDNWVGCMDEPIMGFVKGKKETTFSYEIPYSAPTIFGHQSIQHYQGVVYEKISSEHSLAYLNGILHTNYSFPRPFELKNCKGLFVYNVQKKVEEYNYISSYSNDIWEYAIIDFDSYSNKKANLYYSLVSDPGYKEGTVEIDFVENEGYINTVVINLLDNLFYCYNYYNVGYNFTDGIIFDENATYNSGSIYQYSETGKTVQEVIAEITAAK